MSKMVCVMDGCENPMHGKGVCRRHYMKCWRGLTPWPEYTAPRPPSPSERFWTKVDIAGPDDCWEWQASYLPNGYGQFNYTTAHRYAMIASGNPPSDGQHVDHLCRNIRCVNPSHLENVTPSVNTARGYGPNLAASRSKDRSLERATCKHGHLMTTENTYTPPGNPTWRVCRACKADRQRRRIAQKRIASA